SYPACAPVNLYQEVTLSVPVANPTVADSNGNYFYYVSPGTYIETTFSPGTSTKVVTLGGGGGGGAPEAIYQHNGGLVGQEPALNFQDTETVTFSMTDTPGVVVNVQAAAASG